jgi:hypothetical protein
MTSHRVHGLGCPVPSSGLMPLATAGLLKLLMPTLVDDTTLRGRIERRLRRAGFTGQQVDVDVHDGHAVLEGRLTSWIERSRARREALRETPLVHNRLRVAPRRWR